MSIYKQRGTRMKSNSIVNLLTAVMFSLVTVFSHVGWSDEKKKDEKTAKTETSSELDVVNDREKKTCGNLADASDKELCTKCVVNNSTVGECSKFFPGSNNKCEDALKEYQKKNLEYAKACKSVKSPSNRPQNQNSGTDTLFGDNKTKQTPLVQIDETKLCQERVNDCREKMSNIASGAQKDDPNSVDNILKTVMAVKDPDTYQQYESTVNGDQQIGQLMTTKSCTDSFTNKDVNQKKKDLKTEKKDLEKEIAKLEEDFNKEMKEQNEKNADITKKIEELQSKSKEKNRESDARLREKNTENQKNSINYAKQARDISNKIVTKQTQLKKMQFDYANKLASETTEKINMQCQAVLNKAQECLVKSIKTKGAISEDCKSFPVLTKKRGAGATTELKNKMRFINDQCYQEAESSKKNSAYNQQEAISQINRDIQNLQQDLQDLQNNINVESNNAAKIQQEALREQDENAQSVAQQTQNFNNELQSSLLTSKQNQERLMQKKKELLNKLEELDYEAKTGTESTLTAVEEVITEYESAKDIASEACECDPSQKYTAGPCAQIQKFHNNASKSLKPRKAK